MRSLPLVGPTYPSASALAGAAVCVAPWSLGLPREDVASEDADRGRLLHAGAEARVLGQDVPLEVLHLPGGLRVMVVVGDALEADAVAAKETRWPDGTLRKLRAEVGVLWRPGELGDEAQLVERLPGEEVPGWYAGSADLVYVRSDGVLVVADWKFGPRDPYVAARARDHWQGWSLALYLCTALGISASSSSEIVARFEARYVDERGIWADGHDITQGELDEHAVTLARLAGRVESGEGPRVGAACGRCKAKASCSAWAEAGRRGAELVAPEGSEAPLRPPQTEDEARRLHFVRRAVERWLERAAEWERAYVMTHPPVQLGMGQELRAVPSTRRAVLRTPEALAAIEEVAGPAAIAVETKRTATVASIRDAARAGAGEGIKSASDRKRAKDSAEEAAFAELVRRGAVQIAGGAYRIEVRRSDGTVEVVDRGDAHDD